MTVAFTLPDNKPTRLELLDIAGRLIVSQDVGPLGPGRHVYDLSRGQRFASGVYFIRLTRPGQAPPLARAAKTWHWDPSSPGRCNHR